MKTFYIVGGQQRSPRPLFDDDTNWYEYKKALVFKVNVDDESVEQCLEYISPLDARGEDDPILFKGGSIRGNTLYLATQTEILSYSLPDFVQTGYLSLPEFNDVHHVLPASDGTVLVANSGLEKVMEVTMQGEVIREWNVLGEDPWDKFSRDVDYRKGVNLKPHRAHPNHVFLVGSEIWTTRFEKKDAMCLTHPNQRLDIGIERVHDGFMYEGCAYFTTTNGYLVAGDPNTLKIEMMFNLNDLHPKNSLLGWCRGLHIEDDLAWVGFTRVRPTKFREAVSWVRQGLSRSFPTHIACYDIKRRKLVKEINLEDHGFNAVFRILPVQVP